MSGKHAALRHVAVLGALSGVAQATCRKLAEEGAKLALFARHEMRLKEMANDLTIRGAAQVSIHIVDFVAEPDPSPVLTEAYEALGDMDCIMLFFGELGDQREAERDLSAAHRIIETNFSRAALWLLAGVALLEKLPPAPRRIAAVSSVAGDRGRRSNYIYGAAKAGLSVLAQGLAHRLAAPRTSQLRAVTIKLGFVDTPMTAHLKKGGLLWRKPDDLAQSILAAVRAEAPIVYVPWFWRFIMYAVRSIPSAIFNRLDL